MEDGKFVKNKIKWARRGMRPYRFTVRNGGDKAQFSSFPEIPIMSSLKFFLFQRRCVDSRRKNQAQKIQQKSQYRSLQSYQTNSG